MNEVNEGKKKENYYSISVNEKAHVCNWIRLWAYCNFDSTECMCKCSEVNTFQAYVIFYQLVCNAKLYQNIPYEGVISWPTFNQRIWKHPVGNT